jgi:predicted Zn-dependent protease
MNETQVPKENTFFYLSEKGKIRIHFVVGFTANGYNSSKWQYVVGWTIPEANAVIISNNRKTTTLSHEIGHVLSLLRHSSDTKDLMYSVARRNATNLTDTQISSARKRATEIVQLR